MKIKALLIAVLAIVLMTGVVYAGGGNQSGGLTIRSGVLSIGMEIGYPPMEYYDADGKTPIGFDVSMGKAIAEKMGLRAEFIDTAWDGIFAGVETGKYDCIMSSVTITPERQLAHNFSKPYIGNSMAVVLLKDSPFKVSKPEDLAGLGVSYQAETTAKFFMAKLVEQGLRYTPYEYDKVMSCFDELKLGRVDAIVTDLLVAVDYIAIPNSPFQIVWQGDADEVFGICMKKGNDALTDAINKALDALFADGTMHRLSQQIFSVDMVSAAQKLH